MQTAVLSEETKPEHMFQEGCLHSNQSWASRPWDQAGASPDSPPAPTMGMSGHQQ